ncbi:type I-E CRISPR-associated protein Cas5/CasD [Aerococcus urinae]|uniref:Type I-E CRISPR-associated protein Cas5/CasD n=1 Tax=Aerococcus urinae TaxID=1376 RepID=A0A0X8FD96_9LACT|nr:type I-E CRISPR-associated protein Cas5/CasD [Aerococcus urinae]AMB95143.1 type I-E CRISPR-associated protein Cas5/CasD [Aerococcus urinae]MCY3031859.1 type I-E CRISPR-associated protein Cas5/CasD [Aerococcus urinae]MCY3037147.1 type I-E CRISPR-associated protein Cas5/CasD [Aerococcus urinae]MCY3043906.1 type I-E CRISPR-associated protein Cas5/CasD [Aerococcus urinae]MCY3046297.1 type I-E CRISPR-associated protein Cas5/CasD [Aerococcus urinae]
MKTLVLKFAGPLQAWGTNSHFETRHTDLYPSKSAVIGLISACLGYKRDDDEHIQSLNALDFAVRIDQQGNLLRDYHTAKKYKNNGKLDRTYVTNRYYLEDAIFLVAIGSENEDLINKIEAALKSPYYQPFMGRRALPLNADFIFQSTDKDVLTILKEIPWQASPWYKKNHSKRLSIYADAYLQTNQPSHQRRDRVHSFSQKGRKFSYRSECRIDIIVKDIGSFGDHDAFSVLKEVD